MFVGWGFPAGKWSSGLDIFLRKIEVSTGYPCGQRAWRSGRRPGFERRICDIFPWSNTQPPEADRYASHLCAHLVPSLRDHWWCCRYRTLSHSVPWLPAFLPSSAPLSCFPFHLSSFPASWVCLSRGKCSLRKEPSVHGSGVGSVPSPNLNCLSPPSCAEPNKQDEFPAH